MAMTVVLGGVRLHEAMNTELGTSLGSRPGGTTCGNPALTSWAGRAVSVGSTWGGPSLGRV